MNLNSKHDCIEYISSGLTGSSKWRSGRDRAFPGDPRNAAASARLKTLAVEASDMTDDQWHELSPFYSWASESWVESVSLAMRQVGFSRQPANFAAFVSSLVGILSIPVAK